MEKLVIHLYQKIGKQSMMNFSLDDGFIDLSPLPVAALITNNSVDLPSRKSIIENLKLRPFEILQEHFFIFIKSAFELSVQLLNIQFNIAIDEEIEEEIDEAIHQKSIADLLKIINELKNEGIEIFSISFVYQNKKYKMTKYAVAEIDSNWESISDQIINTPISIIAGLKKCSAFVR